MKFRPLARLASWNSIACFFSRFNTLKRDFAGVFLHPLEQVLTGHQLAFADMQRGKISPIQEDVGSGSGNVEVGL